MARHRIVAVLTTVLLTVTGCGPVAGTGTAGSTSDRRWRACPEVAQEQLTNVPATLKYECTTVSVPQDWAKPDNGRTFDIALLRVRSTQQRNRIGSLLVDPGGPGGSGVDFAAQFSTELPAEILQRFDLVGFDPRGVGRSNPVKCFTDTDLDASFSADPDPVSDSEFDAAVALQARMARGCGARYGDTLRLFSTVQTARDMDAIRVALGDAKLSYLGFSYGTLLGAVYAQLFPDRIRAMVLDGAIDPTQNSLDSAQSQVRGFERAFDNFATWCRTTPRMCPIGPDARATVNDLIRRARTAPVSTRGRAATAGWILTAIGAALYDRRYWPILATALDNLRHGTATDVFTLADSYADRDATGHYANLFDAFVTISCNDDAGSTLSRDKARQLQADWRTAYPLFGASAAVGQLGCADWPTQRDPYPTGRANGAPPIVVIGTTGDPATPYENTARLAEMLGVGVVLTWQGEGHTAYSKTHCVSDLVDRYLVDQTAPKTGTICPPG